jgi:hypothetical protein
MKLTTACCVCARLWRVTQSLLLLCLLLGARVLSGCLGCLFLLRLAVCNLLQLSLLDFFLLREEQEGTEICE